jgi:hypothetical protein
MTVVKKVNRPRGRWGVVEVFHAAREADVGGDEDPPFKAANGTTE